MKTYIFIIIITCFAKYSSAQKNILSTLPKKASNIEAFIPKGYDTLATATGDFNKDNLTDIVLVLANRKEKDFEMEAEPARLLVILFKTRNGYVLTASSNKAIMCVHCGGIFGDPFESITIEHNTLIIHHYGGSTWRWGYTHQFKFQNKDFYLTRQTYNYYWNVKYCDKLEDFAGTNYEDENFLTGKYKHKKISENCKILENEKKKKLIKSLQKLSLFNINKNIQ